MRALLLALVLLVSCQEKTQETPPKSSSPASRPSSPRTDAGVAGRGLTAPDNDAQVVLAVKKAAACPWDGSGFSPACAELRAWAELTDGFEDGRADATLMNLVEDADAKVRALAASKLAAVGEKHKKARAGAERLLVVAEAEKEARVGKDLGAAVARIDVESTGLFERVRLLATRHALASMRAGVVGRVAFFNPTSPRVLELVRELTKDPAREVRLAAISALWEGGGQRPAETCALWLANIDNASDEEVAGRATSHLTHWGRCQEHYEALLDAEEKRFRAGNAKVAHFASALTYMCQDRKVTDVQRRRALALAKEMAESKVTDKFVRGAALEAVLSCDPQGGRGFVKKFDADNDPHVKVRAVELLKPR